MSRPRDTALDASASEAGRNWAGNVIFAAPVQRPASIEQVQDMVAGANKAHGLRAGHSFTAVADTQTGGALLSLAELPQRFEIAPGRDCLTVNGAMTFTELGPLLHQSGVALHNVGSLSHISLAGACSTGTHGAGNRAQCLAAVREVEIVTASGEVAVSRRGDPDFAGMVLAMGTTGIITALTVDVQPTYEVAQTVWQGIDVATGCGNLDGLLDCAYSVGVLTQLQPAGFGDVWVKRRMDEPDPDLSRYGGRPAHGPVRPELGGRADWASTSPGDKTPSWSEPPACGSKMRWTRLRPCRTGAKCHFPIQRRSPGASRPSRRCVPW
ncbi:MAG: FAD-binding protein [Ornithinimicrobium sp.]